MNDMSKDDLVNEAIGGAKMDLNMTQDKVTDKVRLTQLSTKAG